MLFLQLIDLNLANELPVKRNIPLSITKQENLERNLSPDQIKIAPFILNGSAESVDYTRKAKKLSTTMLRRWCGDYISSSKKNKVNVDLAFNKINPIGNILQFQGDIIFGKTSTKFTGYLNVKSNQSELILNSSNPIYGIKPGATFSGLSGLKSITWKTSSFTNIGGTLSFKKECS